MVPNKRMALLEQLSKYVVEKDKDFLKEALTMLINALMYNAPTCQDNFLAFLS